MFGAIEIRIATAEDAAAIESVLSESFAEFRPLYTDEAFAATTPDAKQIQQRINEGIGWVAVQNGNIIAAVSTLAAGKGLYIRGMAALPAGRGAGVGKLLLEHIEQHARREGFERLFLSTTPFLHRAIRLYESYGFRRINDGPHELFGTPLFTMEKELAAD